jgi:hypothetical protein
MKNYTTKYFGELEVDDTEDYNYFDLAYNGESIYISLLGFAANDEKTAKCIEIIDTYPELHKTAKEAIVENYSSNEVIRYYFKNHFDTLDETILAELFGVSTFDDFSVDKVVEHFSFPSLNFTLEDGELYLSADYRVSEEYSEEILAVQMEENLYVLDFSRET